MNPPQGTFSWRYPNTPAELKALWSPTRLHRAHQGRRDGVRGGPGPADRRRRRPGRLEGADQRGRQGPEVDVRLHVRDGQRGLAGERSTSGTTARSSCTAPQHRASPRRRPRPAPTPSTSTSPSETMSGKNPDGCTTTIPGSRGSATSTAATRCTASSARSYGFPQSLGCVEMPFSEAATGVSVHADRHDRQRRRLSLARSRRVRKGTRAPRRIYVPCTATIKRPRMIARPPGSERSTSSPPICAGAPSPPTPWSRT